jgi:hypothetical protein
MSRDTECKVEAGKKRVEDKETKVSIAEARAERSCIDLLESYFYYGDGTDEDICDVIEKWAKKNAGTFRQLHGTSSDEYTIKMSEKHREFLTLFEGLLEGFFSSTGYAKATFYRALEKEELEARNTARTSGRPPSSMARVLHAATCFENFVELMIDVRDGRGVVFCPPLEELPESEADMQRLVAARSAQEAKRVAEAEITLQHLNMQSSDVEYSSSDDGHTPGRCRGAGGGERLEGKERECLLEAKK